MVVIQRVVLALLGVLFATACTGSPVSADAAEAEGALRSYFAALHEGRFEEAASLYAGDYVELEANNPDIDSTDRAGLLERWCRQNGGVCLPIQTVVERRDTGEGTYSFIVQFANDDGSTFERGPCCGAEDTGQRDRDFTYTVVPADSGFVVLELPPYVP